MTQSHHQPNGEAMLQALLAHFRYSGLPWQRDTQEQWESVLRKDVEEMGCDWLHWFLQSQFGPIEAGDASCWRSLRKRAQKIVTTGCRLA